MLKKRGYWYSSFLQIGHGFEKTHKTIFFNLSFVNIKSEIFIGYLMILCNINNEFVKNIIMHMNYIITQENVLFVWIKWPDSDYFRISYY